MKTTTLKEYAKPASGSKRKLQSTNSPNSSEPSGYGSASTDQPPPAAGESASEPSNPGNTPAAPPAGSPESTLSNSSNAKRGGLEINHANLELLFRGYRTIFLEALVDARAKSNGWAMRSHDLTDEQVRQCQTFLEKDAHLYQYSDPQEWESTIAVSREDILKGNFGIYKPFFDASARAGASEEEGILLKALVAGFTETCYTGRPFFDHRHQPTPEGPAFSNKGTRKLSLYSYHLARKAFKTRRNADDGTPLEAGHDLVLIVSPKWESRGKEIVASEDGRICLEVRQELETMPDAWFLLEQGLHVKPLFIHEEIPMEFTKNFAPDAIAEQEMFLFQSYQRACAGFAFPELAWGSTGEAPTK